MKRNGWMMSALAGAVVGLGLGAPEARAEDHCNYRILKADHFSKNDPRSANLWIEDKHTWVAGEAQVEVLVTVRKDAKEPGIYLRVYFFDADNHLIEKADAPKNTVVFMKPPLGSMGGLGAPKDYEGGVNVDAHFPAPAKWVHAVVVFGDADTATARVIPNGELADFDLPEKAQILAGQ